ncbi:MAG: SpoIID/LytB domain-containing protein [Lachnospiraceae bacterium]|nr:SpoIID/LytB domain-containing protein [Lachnospiraceae bacterium]
MKLQDMVVTAFAFVAALLLIPYVITWGMNGVGSRKQQTKQLNYNISLEVALQDGKETMNLETYLLGILPAEIDADMPLEVIKAQAVLLRTKLCSEGAELSAEELGEWYLGESELKERWTEDKYEENIEKFRQAIAATAGETLCYKENYILVKYHKGNGGMILSAEEVLEEKIPYLSQLESEKEIEEKDCVQMVEYDKTRVQELLGITFSEKTLEEQFFVKKMTEHGFVKELFAAGEILDTETAMEKLQLSSPIFYLEYLEDRVRIVTLGQGVPLGMSQYGASLQKGDYQEILEYYYPGTKIKQIYSDV